MKKISFLMLGACFFSSIAWAGTRLNDAEKFRKALGLDAYRLNSTTMTELKIAVIDNGFMGYEAGSDILPATTEIVENYSAEFIAAHAAEFDLGDANFSKPFAYTDHGRRMAQIIWAMSGFNTAGPKFYLLNGNGITNFKRAVAFSVVENVDIVLYSQNRECCGSFNGAGFINDLVNKATSKGILWVNAAGNYGGKVYNGPVKIGQNGWVSFGNQNSLRFRSHLDETQAAITLSWDSSANTAENAGTDKDLDMYVYDQNGNQLGKSELVQVFGGRTLGENESFLSREFIALNKLPKSNDNEFYYIEIKAKGAFLPTDNLRVTVFGEMESLYDESTSTLITPIEFTDASRRSEIMVPADNPNVLTVGEQSQFSAIGPTSDGRTKPDFLLNDSRAVFSDGVASQGTSNAAAFFAGVVAVLKSHKSNLTREQILELANRGSVSGASGNGGWGWLDHFDPGLRRRNSSSGRSIGYHIWRSPLPNELDRL